MTNRELAERCFDAGMRVECIVHLATANDDGFEDDVFEFLTYDCEDLLIEKFQPRIEAQGIQWESLDALLDTYGDRTYQRAEALRELLEDAGLYGWIVVASTRTRTPSGPDSWKLRTDKAFYADTYEEALEQAFAWTASDDVILQPKEEGSHA